MDDNPDNPVKKVVPPERRIVTRSVSRALESQVVGSILNQIDTGIERPVDFLPVDYLNRCADLVFGRTSCDSDTIRVIDEVIINPFESSISFSRKLDRLNMSHGTEGVTAGTSSNVEGAGLVNTDQLSKMMSLLTKQSEVMTKCMDELKQVRGEMISLGNRVSEVESSARGDSLNIPGTSTPERNVNLQLPPTVSESERGIPLRIIHPNEQNRTNNLENSQRPNITNAFSQSEVTRRKPVDLDRWHIRFDGTNREMTVESFVFRIEKMRELYDVPFDQLFTDFQCLVSGRAAQWYWQILEDHADDIEFNYFSLKRELINHFKTADSDYDVISEIIDRKQQTGECFDDFYTEIHNLTFRLKKKIPESELVSIIRRNLKPNLASLMFSSPIHSLADLRHECKRAEKLLKENRMRGKSVHEMYVGTSAKGQELVQGNTSSVDALGFRNNPYVSRIPGNRTEDTKPSLSQATQKVQSFCSSPFHLNLCYVCGMPGDFYKQLPEGEIRLSSMCKSTFHSMVCFACGKGDSYCKFDTKTENRNLAESAGDFNMARKTPENKAQ